MTQRKANNADELENREFIEHFYEQYKQLVYYIAAVRARMKTIFKK